ncbi:MAG: S-layer homology domain-containing protein [Tissierellales bacterium]|nr:S-layer homology domain-containing protein [Tissierellales bacterium]
MKKLSKFAALISTGIIIASASTAFAQIYTDVPDSHWASKYVASMNRLGVIKGYEDATFRPNESITREQAMVMISRILKPSDSEKNAALSKHKTYLNSLGAASWAQKDIAYAIEKKILTKDDVKKFYYNKKATVITREELCIYLTRMMGKEADAKNASIIVMSFIDQELIGDAALKYVYIIQNLGIVQGTPDNKFNPKGAVTRAAMAKMLDLSYKEIVTNGGSSSSSSSSSKDSGTSATIETKEIEGTIETILQSGKDRVHVYVKTGSRKQELVRVDKDSDVKFGSKRIDYDELKEGYDVELTYKVIGSENIATKVKMSTVEKEITAEIYDVKTGSLVLDVDGDRDTYELDDDVEVEIDGEKSRASRLDEDQKGVFKIENGKITEVTVISKIREIKGTIIDIDTRKNEIEIEDRDDDKHTFEIDEDDVDIERDRDDIDFDELEEGDEVEITLEYDEVTKIEAEKVEREIEGYISGITIDGDKSTIKIKDRQSKEHSFEVDKETDIELDDKNADLYDLRIGYAVEGKYSGGTMLEIEAEVKYKEDTLKGRVYKVYEDDDYFKVKIEKDDSDDEDTIKVHVDRDTTIIQGNDKIRLKEMDKDDEVIIVGTYKEDDEFNANSIIVIEY